MRCSYLRAARQAGVRQVVGWRCPRMIPSGSSQLDFLGLGKRFPHLFHSRILEDIEAVETTQRAVRRV